MFIDVHCHLDMIEKDLGKVIDNCRKKNVSIVLTNGVKPEINRKVLEISSKFEEVKPCLGIYPDDALNMKDSEIDKEIDFISKSKVFCIGEVGMDFSSKDGWERQEKIFRKFIGLSISLDIPITVHSRKAEERCIEVLEGLKAKKVVMHYFSGKLKLVDRIVENGWFLSIPTAVKNSEHFQKVVERVPIENLLCETDSPYSHPDKKFPNEPANVVESYKKIAEIKGLSLKETEKIIESNFKRLFN